MNYTLEDLKSIRSFSEEEIKKDFQRLIDTEYSLEMDKKLCGNKIMNYFFFIHTLYVIGRKKMSFIEFLNDKEQINKPYFITYMENNGNRSKNKFKTIHSFFQLYRGSINLFKPVIAKRIYLKFNPKVILDFSAGWGGRMIGALSIPNIKYIGFDTNTKLKKSYEEILEFLNMKDRAKIFFEDSSKIDYSKYEYDMVFTSPPYYTIEKYEEMPDYHSKSDFNDKFLIPVITNSFKYLKPKGTFALNIPIYMYETIRNILDLECDEIIPLYISKRNRPQKEYKEFIYVWFKK